MPRRRSAKPARRRDYAAEYRRRQARAKEAGFESYYDQRMRGGASAVPSDPLPRTRAERQRRRGHAGFSAFLDYIHEGDVVMLADHISRIERSASGRYAAIEKLVVPEDPERATRRFVIHGLTATQLQQMIEAEIEAGAVLTPVPSLDQRRLL